MALWKVQAGKYGEQESAIAHNVVAVGLNVIPDLSGVSSMEDLVILYRKLYPERSKQHIISVVAQVWAFRQRMQIGDWVVVPLKTKAAFAIGKVVSDYEYHTDLGEHIKHTRRVKWLDTCFPRSRVDQDLLHSFRAAMTVCQISRNDAERRIEKLFGPAK